MFTLDLDTFHFIPKLFLSLVLPLVPYPYLNIWGFPIPLCQVIKITSQLPVSQRFSFVRFHVDSTERQCFLIPWAQVLLFCITREPDNELKWNWSLISSCGFLFNASSWNLWHFTIYNLCVYPLRRELRWWVLSIKINNRQTWGLHHRGTAEVAVMSWIEDNLWGLSVPCSFIVPTRAPTTVFFAKRVHFCLSEHISSGFFSQIRLHFKIWCSALVCQTP